MKHFGISAEVYDTLYTHYNAENFTDIVYDIRDNNNFILLGGEKKAWLIFRRYENDTERDEWKLHTYTSWDDGIVNYTIVFESKIREYLSRLLNLDPNDRRSLFDIFSPILSLGCTRLHLIDGVWIDKVYWHNYGNYGTYIVGSGTATDCFKEGEFVGDVVSKYLACAYNTDRKIFDIILGNDVDIARAESCLLRYPIINKLDERLRFSDGGDSSLTEDEENEYTEYIHSFWERNYPEIDYKNSNVENLDRLRLYLRPASDSFKKDDGDEKNDLPPRQVLNYFGIHFKPIKDFIITSSPFYKWMRSECNIIDGECIIPN